MLSDWLADGGIIAHPSEKGGYDNLHTDFMKVFIIVHPSEKGGYDLPKPIKDKASIIAHPSEKGGYDARSIVPYSS